MSRKCYLLSTFCKRSGKAEKNKIPVSSERNNLRHPLTPRYAFTKLRYDTEFENVSTLKFGKNAEYTYRSNVLHCEYCDSLI